MQSRLSHLCLQHRPDRGSSRGPGQTDGHSPTLFHILLIQSRFHPQEVGSCVDGHLLLEAAGTVPPTHQHKGVISIWLKLSDQLPLQVPLDLHTLLVVQYLKARMRIFY